MLSYFENTATPIPYVPVDLTLAQFMLDYQHSLRPGRGSVPCLIDSSTSHHVSLEQLKDRAKSLATVLQHRYHLRDEDVVLIASPNHVDYPVVIWAVHRLGGIITCANPQFTVEELSYQLGICKPSLIVVHSGNLQTMLIASKMAGLPSSGRIILVDDIVPSSCDDRTTPIPSISSLVSRGIFHIPTLVPYAMKKGEGKDKVAFLCWSSGTTGNPKAVAISHHSIICNILQMAVHNGLRGSESSTKPLWNTGDVALGVLPFYHVAGLVIALHLSLFCAMTLVVIPKYELLEMVDCIHRYSISHLVLVPPQAISLSKHQLQSDRNASHVRYILIGAAPVSPHVQQTLVKSFPRAKIGQAYGLTEMTTTVAMVSSYQRSGSLESAGQLLPGIKARVVRQDGRLASYGERGELFVTGPSNALRYYDNPRATQETFFDGWVRTGDEVAISEDNEVFVFDRVKELLKVNGLQVAPAELEGCLLGHPFVDDACVVGVPHPLMGEIPLAYVVPSPSIGEWTRETRNHNTVSEDIFQYVATRKAGYKHLRGGIRFIESIPKSPSGKILRRVLRDKLNAGTHNTGHQEKVSIRAKL